MLGVVVCFILSPGFHLYQNLFCVTRYLSPLNSMSISFFDLGVMELVNSPCAVKLSMVTSIGGYACPTLLILYVVVLYSIICRTLLLSLILIKISLPVLWRTMGCRDL